MNDPETSIIGSSRATVAIRDFARLAAGVDVAVLITGETGTGKGALAATIHRMSRRAAAGMVSVNCAGVPDSLFESEFFGHAKGAFTGAHGVRRGLFEQAHGGTLLLDEIGDLSLPLQAKLLTSIESGEVRRLGSEGARQVDVRVIAATGVDLESAVAAGRFRIDLYHRLLVLSFHMPPLRDRGADRLLLARHFVATFAARHCRQVGDLHPETIRLIEVYGWPGNIRQLAHAMEAAVLVANGPSIVPRDLPRRLLGLSPRRVDTAPDGATIATRYSFYGTRDEERRQIESALRQHQGNLTRTARSLRMSRNTLRSRMTELEVPALRRTAKGPDA